MAHPVDLEVFQRYSDFRPTGFDRAGAGADRNGIADFLVMPVSQTRDSGAQDRSNFRSFLRELGGESETVQVHSFSHWGPGWFELILIDPSDEKAFNTAYELAGALEDYPVVDESDWSDLEYEEISTQWCDGSLSDRVDYCSSAGVSVFAARRDDHIPDRVYEYLRSY